MQQEKRSRIRNPMRLALRKFVKSCWSAPASLECGDDDEQQCGGDGDDQHIYHLPDDLLIECLVRIPVTSVHKAMMVCSKWRHVLKSDEYYQARKKVGSLESTLFLFGGSGAGLSAATYCKSNGQWKAGLLCTMRALVHNEWLLDYHTLDYAFLHAQPAVVNQRIFILGAVPGLLASTSSSCSRREFSIVYNAWTKSLTRAAPMLCPRKKFACCVIDNRIYVAGGASSRRSPPWKYADEIPAFAESITGSNNSNSTDAMSNSSNLNSTNTNINTNTNTNTNTNSSNNSSSNSSSNSNGSSNGSSSSSNNTDAMTDAEVYLPEMDVWKPIAPMPRKRYGCLGAAVNGRFYVIGGLKLSSGHYMQPYAYVGSMDTFDPKNNCWQKTKPMPMGGCVIGCTVVGSCIYMLSSHAVELSLWKYDTSYDTWTKIKPPPIPSPLRIDNYLRFSCVTMDCCVHIIQVGGSIGDLLRRSGRNARGLSEALVLVYNTILDEWSRGPDLPYLKCNAACTTVVHC